MGCGFMIVLDVNWCYFSPIIKGVSSMNSIRVQQSQISCSLATAVPYVNNQGSGARIEYETPSTTKIVAVDYDVCVNFCYLRMTLMARTGRQSNLCTYTQWARRIGNALLSLLPAESPAINLKSEPVLSQQYTA